ncbi:MAG: phage minor head protein [Pseudomonadota bacterium]
MPETDRPAYSFDGGAPPEVRNFLANKGVRPSFSWLDVEPEEHAVAFTVAKAMQADILQDIRDAVQEAIDTGQTFESFQKELRPKLAEKGWWGKRQMIDPADGEAREVQLGSPRRLRTIYRANLRSANMAGKWDRVQRTKRTFPYLEYRTGPSERHRPHHKAKEGWVLHVDDPFWKTWWFPNGWGCKCWALQLTQEQAEARGITQNPYIPTRTFENARTGELKQVPQGIDPGWESNPGLVRQQAMEKMLRDKLETADPMVAEVVARDIATSWRVQRLLAGEATGSAPVAVLSQRLKDALGAETQLVGVNDRTVTKWQEKSRPVTPEVMRAVTDGIKAAEAWTQTRNGETDLILRSAGWFIALRHIREKAEVWIRTMHPVDDAQWARKIAQADRKVE